MYLKRRSQGDAQVADTIFNNMVSAQKKNEKTWQMPVVGVGITSAMASSVLFFEQLPMDITEDDLVEVCARFGSIKAVKLLKTKKAKHKAAMEMDSVSSATAVVIAQPTLCGENLCVSYSTVWSALDTGIVC